MKTSVLPVLKILAVAVILCSSGCSRKPSSTPTLEAARLAVSEAVRYEAPKYAPSELSLAQSKLKEAEQEAQQGRAEKAVRLAEQATIDARYAQSRALAEREQIAAIETHQTTETLKSVR